MSKEWKPAQEYLKEVKAQEQSEVKNFIQFALIWISQNLAIPFWMVGHIHLSLNIYDDIHEILASLGMNGVVALGFWLDYKKSLTSSEK